MESVVTGEAVILDVPVARFPSRLLAIIIDLAVQLVMLAVLLAVLGAARAGGGLDDASAAAIGLTLTIAVIVGYPTLFETLSRGRTLGKLALGLRVVGDDGGPERFRQALVRALAGVIEIWTLGGAPALISSLLSARGKRLGDLFAGTFVVQERLRTTAGTPVTMPPPLVAWAASAELSRLPDDTAAMARSYLSRFRELSPAAREEFGRRLAAQVAGTVSPPPPYGTPPAAYLSAVLAERRTREATKTSRAVPPGGPGSTSSGVPSSGPPPSEPPPSWSAGPGDTEGPEEAPARSGFIPPA